MLTWRSSYLSHTGLVRPTNEDACKISSDGNLFVIADGMGGEGAGDIASNLAVNAVNALWKSSPPNLLDEGDIEMWLDDAVDGANMEIFEENSRTGLKSGSTIVVAIQAPDGMLHFSHAGDSRLYSSRRGLLTLDHALTETQLTRCLGHEASVRGEHGKAFIKPGDRILLCTDGLHALVSSDEIMTALQQEIDTRELAETLVDMALNAGGTDNISVIVINYR